MFDESSAVVTLGAPAVVVICAPGAETATGFSIVVAKPVLCATTVVAGGIVDGVWIVPVASVIVAVFTVPVFCAATSDNSTSQPAENRRAPIFLERMWFERV